METLDPRRSALVIVDLQQGITAGSYVPHGAAEIIARSNRLARRFRAAGGLVVQVSVDWHKGFCDAPDRPCDMPAQRAPDGPAANFAQFDEALDVQDGDLRIVKRQWGAFYGTELDLQLRRRGIDTLVLCGIATNMGVESTARDAWERHYTLVFAEDAMGSFTADMHRFPVAAIFPRLGFVRSTEAVEDMLQPG
ncbi:hydrolase [Croceicoccus sp. Ery5]|uniref:hydrolase n=1 Tax=Croceicoccus sp. Ery5 TaxID=1703340 RepID=UPI001E3AE46B|nr:hydrolase [Croceicoccus sp. Ery5]